MSGQDNIIVRKAKVNNLKDVTVEIPRGKFVVITGISGSGKSSLAFDTLFAEGQRRFAESLSSYARQFLGRMSKPDVELIEGIPPAIAIEQRVNTKNPRSTIATSTEIFDYLRMIFARIGRTYSPVTGLEVKCSNASDVLEYIYEEGASAAYILADLNWKERTDKVELMLQLKEEGYTRLYGPDGAVRIEEVMRLAESGEYPEELFLLIDRLRLPSADEDLRTRLHSSVETAFDKGAGTMYVRKEFKDGEPQNILGWWYPLNEIYPLLSPDTTIYDVHNAFFQYIRPFGANYADDNSPLGVSIYGNALETLHAIDIVFDSFVREFRLGKKRIIVPARMIRKVVDPTTGKQVRYFDATDETYEALSTDDPDNLKIQDNSVELRVDEHVAAMNAFLNIFCLQVGLSAGTFSFDASNGLKTATEVVSENSKTYKTVKNFQNQIKPAIEHLVDAIISVAALYDVRTEDGQSVATLAARGYETKVSMDDGITQDRQTNINEGITLVGAGLMSKKTFLTNPKYGQNLTEEDADAELQRIAQENTITMPRLDVRDFNGIE